MRQTTAHDVVDAEIPGDLNVFFAGPNITIQAKDQSFVLDLDGDAKVPTVPVGEDIQLVATIENNATTESDPVFGSGNPDSCTTDSGDDGTALRLVLGGGIEGSVETCIEDSTVASGPNTDTVGVTFQVPDAGLTYYTDIWIEGANSGVRVTPKYRLALFTPALDDPNGNTDFDDGDPISDDPELPEFEFDYGEFSDSCSISRTNITEGESVEVDVDFEGFLSLDAPEGSREIGVYLYVDGENVGEGVGYVTVNGSGGASFELNGLSPGDHSVSYALEDRGWA